MFALETQLRETANRVILGPASFARARFNVVFSLACLQKRFQNILKRTTPGSRDEDTATKAFNELKKVLISPTGTWLSASITTVITVLVCVSSDHQGV